MVSTERPPPPAEAGGTVEAGPDSAARAPVRGPALIVLGLALLIVVAGAIGSLVDTGGPPTTTVQHVRIADGTTVALTPAITAMRSIIGNGQPPSDILGNLAVPAGSQLVRTLDTGQGGAQYDETAYFSTRLGSAQVVDVYRTLLPKIGWSLTYHGSTDRPNVPGTEVLAKKGADDGYYWEIGVVASPTSPTGMTQYSVELFQQQDAD